MPAADVHAPGRDLGGANLVDPPVSEGPHRLREQPAQLRHGLGLAAVLRQVEIDELTQPWCLDEALLAPQPRERSLKRLACGLFAFEPAALQPSGVPTGDPIAVGPDRLAAMAPRLQLENLTLLLHPVLLARGPVRSSSGRRAEVRSELCNRCCRFRHNRRVSSRRTSWVLLVYRLPRDPSTPRSALWRKLRRLGA